MFEPRAPLGTAFLRGLGYALLFSTVVWAGGVVIVWLYVARL